jgi:hypothetical protein
MVSQRCTQVKRQYVKETALARGDSCIFPQTAAIYATVFQLYAAKILQENKNARKPRISRIENFYRKSRITKKKASVLPGGLTHTRHLPLRQEGEAVSKPLTRYGGYRRSNGPPVLESYTTSRSKSIFFADRQLIFNKRQQ